MPIVDMGDVGAVGGKGVFRSLSVWSRDVPGLFS